MIPLCGFRSCLPWLAAWLMWGSPVACADRVIPRPLADHPGNVFLVGEGVAVKLPPGSSTAWRLLDYDGRLVSQGQAFGDDIPLGKLPAGFYELVRPDANAASRRAVSIAVLPSLRAPIPMDSPIGLDVAMSWFYPEAKMPAVANLCALAGINWVRDRLNWAEMEPTRGQFVGPNRYDAAARSQANAGLRLLQVIHLSPGWANTNHTRFPLDLRDAYHFFEAMGRRWRNQVLAFEPWNEADIEMFGGHTGSEISSMQKASYLGLKAGNPSIVGCQNVFALHNTNQLADFQDNRAWPYFDTFNLHHYTSLDSYPALYADFRAVAAGKPLWVTECNIPVRWSGDARLKEPSENDLRIQAQRVARVFATSLFEGGAAVFYFLLPHYSEGQIQFGVLRPDLTPRPAYVALAAAGRCLADARPLGRLKSGPPKVSAYAFAAKPDGKDQTVLVAWAAEPNVSLTLPIPPLRCLDHLGRELTQRGLELNLGPTPWYVILPERPAGLDLDPPPRASSPRREVPSPVVFQALWPKARLDLSKSAYRLTSNQKESLPIYLYNFANHPVQGTCRVDAPSRWHVQFPTALKIDAGDRIKAELVVESAELPGQPPIGTVCLEGDFGIDGQAVLSLRLEPL